MNEIIEKIHAQGYSQSRAAKILGIGHLGSRLNKQQFVQAFDLFG
jgi:hypothetical protein